MNIEYKVKDLIKKYNTSNIKELVDHLDISIEYQDFKAKTLDSRLMIVDSKGYNICKKWFRLCVWKFSYSTRVRTLRPASWWNISFNFLRRVYKTRLEREANEFAIRLLMYKELHNIKRTRKYWIYCKRKRNTA